MSSARNPRLADRSSLLSLDAARIDALVSIPSVIDRMRLAFAGDYIVPTRQILDIQGGTRRQCLVMPAFDRGGGGVVKLSTVFPDNRQRGIPTIQGVIVVFSNSGTPIALLDGGAVTRMRTAAVSALASTYLSRAASSELLMIGTGALAPSMAEAHCTVRPIDHVRVWGRRPEAAVSTTARIRAVLGPQVKVSVACSLEAAAATADIVSCATSSTEPVLSGKWLKPGAFVDLVGSFSPDRREADDATIHLSRVFVDTYDGALKEAGDLMDPLARGIITLEHIVGELADLVLERVKGRTAEDEITLFKSVGTAIEDLALARLLIEAANG